MGKDDAQDTNVGGLFTHLLPSVVLCPWDRKTTYVCIIYYWTWEKSRDIQKYKRDESIMYQNTYVLTDMYS